MGGLTSLNVSSVFFIEQMMEDRKQSFSCHLHSSTKLQPTQPPSEKTQRGSGELSQTHDAELMGVDGGGVTVSASVNVLLWATMGEF